MPVLLKNYTGKTIGNRLVIAFVRFTEHKDPMWLVRCTCGNEFESLTQDLKRRQCRGCRMRHRRKRPYESLYNAFVQKASKRYSVSLSYDEFLRFTEITECHYCGDKIDWLRWQTKRNGVPYRGLAYNLDRKDNNEPYTISNVVVCCARCNRAKNRDFSYEEWRQIGNLIRSWRRQ
jgi:hypothetical protein